MFDTQAHPNETRGSCVPPHCSEYVNFSINIQVLFIYSRLVSFSSESGQLFHTMHMENTIGLYEV